MTRRPTTLPYLVVFLLSASLGCEKAETNLPPPVSARDKLADIGAMYKEYTKDTRRPPRKLSDFDHPYEPAHIEGYAALRDGECVMLWGGGLPGAKAGATVLAYEKAAPDQGGLVLLQDGTVKQMTADEFKAAPKAK